MPVIDRAIVNRSISSRVTGCRPAAVMSRTAWPAPGGREERDQGRPRRWRGSEAEDGLGDEPERALRPDEQLAQGIAGDVLHRPAAGPDDLSVGQDDSRPSTNCASGRT
jgi:hypothetical protein